MANIQPIAFNYYNYNLQSSLEIFYTGSLIEPKNSFALIPGLSRAVPVSMQMSWFGEAPGICANEAHLH